MTELRTPIFTSTSTHTAKMSKNMSTSRSNITIGIIICCNWAENHSLSA